MASTKKKRTPNKKNRWSQRVTATSDALDLDKGVFSLESPRAIARSLFRRLDAPGLTRLRMSCARYTIEDRPADGLCITIHADATIRFGL